MRHRFPHSRTFPLVVVLLVLVPRASATGWNDFTLQIDPHYKIVRANVMDIMLCTVDGFFVIDINEHTDVGPLVGYAVTDTHIFVKHLGREPRNLFAGDTYEEVDAGRQFYFVVRKSDGNVEGPFDESEFHANLTVAANDSVNWKRPRNPNILLPVAGTLFFLAFTAVMFGARSWCWQGCCSSRGG